MVAHADEGAVDAIAGGDLAQRRQRLALAAAGAETEAAFQADRRGDHRRDQLLQRVEAEALQHLAPLLLRGAEMPRDKGIERLVEKFAHALLSCSEVGSRERMTPAGGRHARPRAL